MKYEQKASQDKRGATYSEKKVRCPNAFDHRAMHSYGTEAKPGDLVRFRIAWKEIGSEGPEEYRYHWGRVLGRVDAYAIGDIPAVKGDLAILMLADNMRHAYEVWISPENIVDVMEPSPRLLEFFMAEKLPPIPEVLRLARNGSICERYIDKPIGDCLCCKLPAAQCKRRPTLKP